MNFLLFPLAAQANPQAAEPLLHALIVASGQDGATAPAGDLKRRFSALCEAADPVACDARAWAVPFDQGEAIRALEPRCESGHAAACVMVGWALSQRPWGIFRPHAAADPVRAKVLFERACSAGSSRGCVEVARASMYGVGTYQSRSRARELLQPLCDAGEAYACHSLARASPAEDRVRLYQRAAELGDPTALRRLAASQANPQAARDLRRQACDQGVGAACADLAQADAGSPERARELLTAACANGDIEGCAMAALYGAQTGERTMEDAVAPLHRACQHDVVWACDNHGLLSQGALARAWPPGEVSVGSNLRIKTDLKPGMVACYRDRLRRGDVAGEVLVTLQIAADGAVEGAVPRGGWVDDPLTACVFDAGLALGTIRAPTGGAARTRILFRLGHTVQTTFRPTKSIDAPYDITAAAAAMQERAEELDRCAYNGGDARVRRVVLDGTVARNGSMQSATVVRSSGSPAVDACVRKRLAIGKGRVLQGPLQGRVEISFVAHADYRRQSGIVQLPHPDQPPPPWTEDPLVWRLLVIVVEDNVVDGRHAKLGDKSLQSIVAAHQGAADFISAQTGGRVQVEFEVASVPGPLDSAFVYKGGSKIEDQTEPDRWVVDVSEVPTEITRTITPGAQQSIALWAPVPRGFSRPYYSFLHSGERLQGSLFTSFPLVSNREVHGNDGLPGWYNVAASLYSHLRYSAYELGHLLPSPRGVTRLSDGRVLDPRDHLNVDDPLLWYKWAFSEAIHPDLWVDMLE